MGAVSRLQDDIVLVMSAGDGCTVPGCALKNAYHGKFYVMCISPQ
jgi:hypothetical protein